MGVRDRLGARPATPMPVQSAAGWHRRPHWLQTATQNSIKHLVTALRRHRAITAEDPLPTETTNWLTLIHQNTTHLNGPSRGRPPEGVDEAVAADHRGTRGMVARDRVRPEQRVPHRLISPFLAEPDRDQCEILGRDLGDEPLLVVAGSRRSGAGRPQLDQRGKVC